MIKQKFAFSFLCESSMHLLLFVCGQYLFFYSCFKKIIVSFLQLKSLLLFLCVCVCVTESMSWLPGATVGPEADTGHCSDAGGSPHHDCSETTTQNAH